MLDVLIFLAFAALVVLAWVFRPWGLVALVPVVLLVGLAVGGKAVSKLSDAAWLEAASALHEAGADEFTSGLPPKLRPGFPRLRAFATLTSADGREVQVYLEYTANGWRVVPRPGTYFPPPAAVPR
ncbi:MAG: hypothetical protein ACYC41_02430 [Bacillota bacterium]